MHIQKLKPTLQYNIYYQPEHRLSGCECSIRYGYQIWLFTEVCKLQIAHCI